MYIVNCIVFYLFICIYLSLHLEVNGYVGCMNSSLLNPVLTDATPIRSTCRSLCKNSGFRYMMLTNSSCFCGIHGNRSAPLLSNDYCNATCTSSITNGFCGGPNGEQSVYYIWGKFHVCILCIGKVFS